MPRGQKGTAMSLEQRREQKRAYQVEWRKRNPHYYKEWARNHYGPHRPRYLHYARKGRLKALFDLTVEDYEKMLSTQNGVCAICGNPPKNYRLSVDHNHKTGKIRGLLCVVCNTSLGALENVEFVSKAQLYLEKY